MILIDIEMPEKCGLCPCFHAEFPMYCKLINPPDKNKRIVAPYGLPRPEWCPLEEQEAITVDTKVIGTFNGDMEVYCCRDCRTILDPAFHYCPNCGKEVKWE